ncbi:ATP-binding protein [Maridesulfovibrio sp.]|uniref:ATP-binding protein n=1 Tax=Maridesulfovibrio sp. TaxID=2795000 RepID=UPI0039F0785E
MNSVELKTKGFELYKNKNFHEASTVLAKYLTENPKDFDAITTYAKTLVELHEYINAINILAVAFSKIKNTHDYVIKTGRQFTAKGLNYDKHEKYLFAFNLLFDHIDDQKDRLKELISPIQISRTQRPILRDENLAFQASARLLLLLGDELIRDARYAAFELVKNAYDADATTALMEIHNPESVKKGKIIFQDDGHGMDWETVTNVWLVPGTIHRKTQVANNQLTPKFKRLPLGSKGVGRFAAHKLGKKISLITRKQDFNEIVISIDWNEFENKKYKYLDQVPIQVTERTPEIFIGDETGTRIEISDFHNRWTRGDVRQLHREIMSICSPYDSPDSFQTILEIFPDKNWLKNLFEFSDATKLALQRATCLISGGSFSYSYRMNPFPLLNKKVSSRDIEENQDFKFKKMPDESDIFPADYDSYLYDPDRKILEDIGPIKLDLNIFDLEKKTLNLLEVGDQRGLRAFLKENGGISVYRDKMRVYGYGESHNDWLRLGDRRATKAAKHLGNNQILGAISLNLAESSGLIEKTNREGFVENSAFKVLRKAVLEVISVIEQERNIDKERIRDVTNKSRLKEPVLQELSDLRERIVQKAPEVEQDLLPYLERAEKEFLQVREELLVAAGSGLSLGVVIHEAEKRIIELNKAIDEGASGNTIKTLAVGLSKLIEGFTYLMRKSPTKKEDAQTLVSLALNNCKHRLKYHKVEVINGFHESDSFSFKGTRRLIVASIMNLIDNSIYWLDRKNPDSKKIFIGPTRDYSDGPAIIIADNGPGISDEPEILVRPFITRKRDGMGLGLYLANSIMELHNGKLVFPETYDVTIPEEYTGAVVGMLFKEEK